MPKNILSFLKLQRELGKVLRLIFLNLISLNAICQKELNNWYFGTEAGITFNSGIPTALTNGKMATNEGCASMSDKNGNLLFYTDGVRVWDRAHKRTTNGHSLLGHASATQSAIIVPRPLSSNQYYIFTVGAQADINGLQYSIFNMDLNSGYGDIEPNHKNIKLLSPVCEKISAIKHFNGRDYWVITHKFDSDTLYAYLLTSAGIKGKPIKSASSFNLTGNTESTIGYMKFSHDGTRIVYANVLSDWFGLGDFNRMTGEVTNVWQCNIVNPYGVEFSPSGQYLYVSSYSEGIIYQYDTKANYHKDFLASEQEIYKLDCNNINIGALQLGPDRKIYVCSVGYNYLDVIHAPDSAGSNCRARKNYVNLQNKWANFGLPSFPQSYLWTGPKFTAGCYGDTAWFDFVNGAHLDSIKWEFGDTKSGLKNKATGEYVNHVFTETGEFKVRCISYISGKKDTFYLYLEQKAGPKFSLGPDIIVCHTPYLILGSSLLKFAEYTWSDNSRDTFLYVSKNGEYSLSVKDENGCKGSNTIKVQFLPFPKVNLGRDTHLCGVKFITLDAKNNTSYTKYIWNTADTGQKVIVYETGFYMVDVTTPCGTASDSIHLRFLPIPDLNLPKDSLICDVSSLILDASIKDPNAFYFWSSGSNKSSVIVTTDGLYKIKAVNDCGFDEDSTNITFSSTPKVDLGPDKVFCDTMFPVIRSLKARNEDTLRWSTSCKDTLQTFNMPGTYWAFLSNRCGSSIDTFNITLSVSPVVDLGKDTGFCDNFEFLLDAGNLGASYTWQPTGESTRIIFARKYQTYEVTVKNADGCIDMDKLTITDNCKNQYWFPDIFSPNGDNLNETFSPVLVNCQDFRMEIFNQWGELLFVTNDPKNHWDGAYRGSTCQQGVYHYLCRFVISEYGISKLVNGNIHLMR